MAEAVSQATERQNVSPEKLPVMQQLLSKARAQKIPLHAMLELTNNCNLWCRHCYISDRPRKGELTTDEFKDILDQLAAEGTLFLTLSGGEPLVRKDFFQIAEYIRKKEFTFVLFTNGTLITPEVADRLQALYPQRVEISLLGGTSATHDGITQVKGSFDKALTGAKLLIERGVQVQLKTTWMRENIEESELILSLVEELGASFREGYIIIYRRDGDVETTDLRPTPDQLRAMMERRYGHNPDYKPPPEPPSVPEEIKQHVHPCGAGQTSCCIDSYGNVRACAAIDTVLGNLRKERFTDIWNNSEELERIRSIMLSDLPECGSCNLFFQCNRCAGLAKMETGSLLGRPSQCCEVTHALEGFYREKRCELL